MSAEFELRELEDLFQQAIALPSAAHPAFLNRNCQGRPTLLGELRRMLDAHANAGEFLDCSLPSYLNASRQGTQIGRWKLSEPIGEGGLGVVYRASCEADGVMLHAAVKVLRAGFHASFFKQRFIEERSILSGLDHPYIARLIDAGADASGDSFLAVEFINGRPLDRYLEDSNTAPGERLSIFIGICEAVEYLHCNRIVHGDIKPANVMVKEDATPKLLDFGTARLIEAGGPVSFARFSRLIMTPGYASPEQTAGLGPSVLGDVYSLGCVLRDMLGQAAPAELSAIRDRCLAPAPGDRYQSPRDIAADIQRYLTHFPVRAHAGSGCYAALKFMQRNRTGCILSGFALPALLMVSLLSWHHSRRADLYSSQNRSVITQLVGDRSSAQTSDSNNRTAVSGSIQAAIAQLEAMEPQPLAELSGAWRRLGYIESTSGQSLEGMESILRSVEYARRNVAVSNSPEARGGLADSLLHAAFLQNRRGYAEKAAEYAVEAIGLIKTLTTSDREGMERKPEFLYILFAAARRMARSGDVPGGREVLLRGLEKSRLLNKSLQLRMLLDLAVFEQKAGNNDQVESYCSEAKALELTGARLRNVCNQERPEASGLTQEMTVLERRLAHAPDDFGDRSHLARLKLQLARSLAGSGETARAGKLIEEAHVLTAPMLEADPRNRRLHHLSRSIKRGRLALNTEDTKK